MCVLVGDAHQQSAHLARAHRTFKLEYSLVFSSILGYSQLSLGILGLRVGCSPGSRNP